ncbi:MAG: hypothetical protein HOF72_03155 [Planctomycetaceae bacterium]|jgi:hypothetical protein|nr:hypothetical protein [Planctomycetaceae bacterium]
MFLLGDWNVPNDSQLSTGNDCSDGAITVNQGRGSELIGSAPALTDKQHDLLLEKSVVDW